MLLIKLIMKTISALIVILLYFSGIIGCKKEDVCPKSQNLGLLRITEESKSYIPGKYFSETDSLVFISVSGAEKKFYLDRIFEYSGSSSTEIQCEYDPEVAIRVSYKPEEKSIRFISRDSFTLRLHTKVGTSPKGYYDSLSIWLSDDAEEDLNVLGQINITTDLRTVSSEDEIYNPVYYSYYDSISIMGTVFDQVYGDKQPQVRMSDVYWKQNLGLIGFREKNGTEWVLQQ